MLGKKAVPVAAEQARILAGTEIHGSINSQGVLEINGRVEGAITHRGRLLIGRTALCLSDIRAEVLEVAGEVRGSVQVEARLEILATGRIYGTVACGRLVVREGGILNADVQIAEAQAAARPAPRPPLAVPLGAADPEGVPAAPEGNAAPVPESSGGIVIPFDGSPPLRAAARAMGQAPAAAVPAREPGPPAEAPVHEGLTG